MANIRLAHPDEEKAILLAYVQTAKCSLDEVAGHDIYVREDFISGGPGYVGPVAIIHWDGDPTFVSVGYKMEGEFGKVWHFPSLEV